MRRINKERLEKLRGAVLIADMRSPEYFRNGSLPNAKNLPLKNLVNELHRTDRKTNIIIVANEATENDVKLGCNYAEQLGFHKVFVSDIRSLL